MRPLLASVWEYGWLGVEFFFVLSGFIITYIHLKDLESRKGVAQFLRKRFIRIYPIYWVVATIMLIYYLFIKKENQGVTVRLSGMGDFIYLVKCYSLFPTSPLRKNFIDIAWTLSYEVWFYLLFAFCILLGYKRTSYFFIIWGFLIVFKHYTHIGDFSPFLNFILNPMILYFLAGCFIGYLSKKGKASLSLRQFVILIIIASMSVFSYAALSGSVLEQNRWDINYYYLLIVLFGITLWMAVSIDRQSWLTAPSKKLLLIGDASYSLYLIHPAVIMFCYKMAAYLTSRFAIDVSSMTVNLIFIGTMLMATLAGLLLHLIVEKPLLSLLNKNKTFSWRLPWIGKPL